MVSARTYLLSFFAAMLAGAAVLGSFNYVVDPYQIFDFVTISKFNQRKPMNRRLFMPIDVTRAPSDFAVLGSSRASAVYEALKASKPDQSVVDAHLSALRSREAVEFLRLFANRPEIKSIVYGSDFFSFNRNSPYHAAFIPGIVGEGRLWRLKMIALLGLSATQGSVKTIMANVNPKVRAKQANDDEEVHDRDSGQLRDHFRFQLMNYQSRTRYYKDFKLDTGALAQLTDALREVKASGKQIVVLIGPSHALQWEAIHKSNDWSEFENWKRGLAEVSRTTGVAIWDFASFSPVSTVPTDQAFNWYLDSSHFTAEVATMVLDCVFEQKQCERVDGARLEPSTIEARLQSIREKRSKWLAGEGIQRELELLDYPTVQ
jgi:hypothetical protein